MIRATARRRATDRHLGALYADFRDAVDDDARWASRIESEE